MANSTILYIRFWLKNLFKKKEVKIPEIQKEKKPSIDLDEERRKSLLDLDKVYITDNIYVRIPTVREILKDEQSYYSIVHSFTAVPYQFMVQLDDMGIDYTTITPYQLFLILFPAYSKTDLSLIFGDLNTSDYTLEIDEANSTHILHSTTNGMECKIDEFVYSQLVDILRKIHNLEEVKKKPGNDEAKRYLLKRERKRQKRNKNKPYEPYLEKLVIALVNCPEFKYNYEETMDLSIYRFMQSFKQIQTRITFDNTMIGVYAGTVDTSKMSDKSCLSWIPIK